MPDGRVIVDTGPLVAFMVQGDAHHVWAVEQFKQLPAPFLTCEPVLTEAYHLVHRLHGGGRRFFELMASGLLHIDFDLAQEQAAVAKLARKYADVPMSLADACVVRMAEIHTGAWVFTVDGHFRVYRKHGRQVIPTIMP